MRRSKEEVLLDKLARKDRVAERIRIKEEKAAAKIERQRVREERRVLRAQPKPPKVEPTEQELVKRYVNRVINNQMYHGRVDPSKYQGLDYKTPNKRLWNDADFYFSVVFQSAEQKYQFLKAMKIQVEEFPEAQIQIVNGLRLAEQFGIMLKPEKRADYPLAPIDLLPLVLDNEVIET